MIAAQTHMRLAFTAALAIGLIVGIGNLRSQTPGPVTTGQPFTGNPLQQIGAHISLAGNIPAMANCGTGGSIQGSDEAGHIVPGTSPSSSCAITFAVAWNNRPTCTVSAESATISYSVTLTGIIFSTPISGVRIDYLCFGRAGG